MASVADCIRCGKPFNFVQSRDGSAQSECSACRTANRRRISSITILTEDGDTGRLPMSPSKRDVRGLGTSPGQS